MIGGEGSYTFTAWIKPSDLGGDKFLFGQSSQGIHNGIRNNGFLHQAHWGADTNGATNLNDYDASANDGWIHAAWTYDGATDTGKIYLDGVEDYSGDKRAPNGSGNLIIGGRNGGGQLTAVSLTRLLYGMSQLVLNTSPNLLQVRAHLMMTVTDYLTHGQLDLVLLILTVMLMKTV